MKTFTIYWTGTVFGSSQVEAEAIEEAIHKAENPLDYPDVDENIQIDDYPSDWDVDDELTISSAEAEG